MNDLATQLRDYIDGIAEPVQLEEVTNAVTPPVVRSPRTTQRAVLVAIAAIVVIALVVGATRLWSSSDDEPVTPAHAPSVGLVPVGPADCSAVVEPGYTLLVATKLSHGHTACVTQKAETTTVYFDGRLFVTSTGSASLSQQQAFLSVRPSSNGNSVLFGNLPDAAHFMRLIFCDGKTLELLPINSTSPRFVAAIVNSKKYGSPGSQLLDAAGNAAGPAVPASPPQRPSTHAVTEPRRC